jgi:hypothetical protein
MGVQNDTSADFHPFDEFVPEGEERRSPSGEHRWLVNWRRHGRGHLECEEPLAFGNAQHTVMAEVGKA